MFQPKTAAAVLQGVKTFGPSPGGKKMMEWEFTHAYEAVESGIYLVWRSRKNGEDCFRVGSASRWFWGHYGKDHDKTVSKKKQSTKCNKWSCKAFNFIPRRPEEWGLYHLPRRKGFDVNKWRGNWKCKHSHEEHDPVTFGWKCGCYNFESDFWCIGCEAAWEDHETVLELESERASEGKPIGADFLPMADNKEIQHATLKSLAVSKEVKELAGYVDLTEAELLEEEEKKELMNSEDQVIQINDPHSKIDISLTVKGKANIRPKQDTSKPEKSIKFMQKKGLIKK